jgi:solute carrier family 25 iron transporter 28/37
MTPFDVIKQRMQLGYAVEASCQGTMKIKPCAMATSRLEVNKACSQHESAVNLKRFSSTWHCFRFTLHNEGARAFFVSLPITLMMNIPFHAIHFSVYDFLREIFMINHNSSKEGEGKYHYYYLPLIHCLSGAIAGGTAAFMTTPLDVTKTLLQTRGLSSCVEIRSCGSLVDAAKIIYKREGLKGFTRGSLARVIAHMPSTAISWTVYEYFKAFWLSSAASVEYAVTEI